jgi:uncharacterized protein (TIGR04255 family)
VPFPAKKRVVFTKNPLDRVICQFRFPPILKIDTEVPAEFQERIRDVFPNLSESTEFKIEFSSDAKQSIPPEGVQQFIKPPGNINYEFASEDGLWKLNLTRYYITLTSMNYERWELFKEKLQTPLTCFVDIYKPAHVTRIGLRYIDVIKRSLLNLDGVAWKDLLSPSLLGPLGDEVVGKEIKNFESMYNIQLSDNESMVRLITKSVVSADDGEECYVIDSDFFNSNKSSIDEAKIKLDFLNERASRLIQWCISEDLYKSMEPQ